MATNQKLALFNLRLPPENPLQTAKIIETLIRSQITDFNNALTVVDKNGIRQKKY